MELHTPKYVKVLQYVVMIIMALFMFFPIYWIFVNSLKNHYRHFGMASGVLPEGSAMG